MDRICPKCAKSFPRRAKFCPGCGVRLLDGPEADLTGTRLQNRYLLERNLGTSGVGTGYEASDLTTGVKVVVKVVRQTLVAETEAQARFLKEATMLTRLRNPNIVPIIDSGLTQGGAAYWVREEAAGVTLGQLIKEEAPFDYKRTWHFSLQLCEALHAAHRAGILHLNLKPSNVICTTQLKQKMRLRVLDFGLGRMLCSMEEAALHGGIVLGTPQYMSPEQAIGRDCPDVRSDIYSLAIIMYQMLCGHPPFEARSAVELIRMQASVPPPPLEEKNPQVRVHPAVGSFLTAALAKDPALRPQSVVDFVMKLREVNREIELELQKPSPVQPVEPPSIVKTPDAVVEKLPGADSSAFDADVLQAAKEATQGALAQQELRVRMASSLESGPARESQQVTASPQRPVSDMDGAPSSTRHVRPAAEAAVSVKAAEETAESPDWKLWETASPATVAVTWESVGLRPSRKGLNELRVPTFWDSLNWKHWAVAGGVVFVVAGTILLLALLRSDGRSKGKATETGTSLPVAAEPVSKDNDASGELPEKGEETEPGSSGLANAAGALLESGRNHWAYKLGVTIGDVVSGTLARGMAQEGPSSPLRYRRDFQTNLPWMVTDTFFAGTAAATLDRRVNHLLERVLWDISFLSQKGREWSVQGNQPKASQASTIVGQLEKHRIGLQELQGLLDQNRTDKVKELLDARETDIEALLNEAERLARGGMPQGGDLPSKGQGVQAGKELGKPPQSPSAPKQEGGDKERGEDEDGEKPLISSSVFKEAVAGISSAMSDCYREHGGELGPVTVITRLTIAESGGVSNVAIVTGSIVGTPLGACIRSVQSGMKFPPFEGPLQFKTLKVKLP